MLTCPQAYLLIGEIITDAKSYTRKVHERPGHHMLLELTCPRENAVALYNKGTRVPRIYRNASLKGFPGLVERELTGVWATGVFTKHSQHAHVANYRKAPEGSQALMLDAGHPLTSQKRLLPS